MAAIGYWLLLLISLAWQDVSVGTPSYGIILVLLGAAFGIGRRVVGPRHKQVSGGSVSWQVR